MDAGGHPARIFSKRCLVPDLKPFTLALVPLCLCLSAIPALWVEMSVYVQGGHSAETRRIALREGQLSAGWSTRAHQHVMELCREVIFAPIGDEAMRAARPQVLDTCRERTARILDLSPVNGLAWAVRAATQQAAFRLEAAQSALERSHAAAPEEAWIAARRVHVAERMLPLLSPAQYALYQHDLGVIARDWRGRAYLARKYVASAEQAEHILRALETHNTPEAQRAFVVMVREAMRTPSTEGAT